MPVYGSVKEAVEATGANVSVIFVPAQFTKAAAVEAIDAEIPLAVVITEGVAVKDTAEFYNYAKDKGTTRLVGPNCPGLITPGVSNAGIIPADISGTGRIGLVSKSGTLTYQMMYELRDFGFSSPSASAATRSSARRTSTASRRSRTTPTPTRSS